MKTQAIIEVGNKTDPSVLMLHGGPGYYWKSQEIARLSHLLHERGVSAHLMGLQARGCGTGDYISYSNDLLDDNLIKRAADLAVFKAPDILLGHSTGAMVALTAVIEGYIQPKQIVLLSPYTASLGEQDYWVNEKAALYPNAFNAFYNFTQENWQKYKGDLPPDFREKLYIYWGHLFFALPEDGLKIKAKLHYLLFHVISSVPALSYVDNQPVTIYDTLLEQAEENSRRVER